MRLYRKQHGYMQQKMKMEPEATITVVLSSDIRTFHAQLSSFLGCMCDLITVIMLKGIFTTSLIYCDLSVC